MTDLGKLALVSLAAVLVAGCGTTAKHNVTRSNAASSVRVIDAPVGATVQAGQLAVRADAKGEARLVLSDGWHVLRIFDGQTKIHEERVFLQDGSQKLIDLEP